MPTLIGVYEYRFVEPGFTGTPEGYRWQDWVSRRFSRTDIGWIEGSFDHPPLTAEQAVQFRKENPVFVAKVEREMARSLERAVVEMRRRRGDCEAAGHGCGMRDGLRWCEWRLRQAEASSRTDERTWLITVDVP